MRTTLKFGEQEMLFTDCMPGFRLNDKSENIIMALMDITAEDAQKYYDKLSVDTAIKLKLQETFWSNAYSILIDKYGIQWQISAEKDFLGVLQQKNVQIDKLRR